MKWISVKERMPKRLTWVIVYGSFGINPHVDWGVWTGEEWMTNLIKGGLSHKFEEVTHWMELPKPPKTE